MTRGDFIQLYGTLGAMGVFIVSIVVGTWKAKTYFDNKFSETRRFVYDQMAIRDRAIRRLEYGAVLNWVGFQPGADQPALRAADADLERREHP